jgi:hypothetical protein
MAANTSSSNEDVPDHVLVRVGQWDTAAAILAALPPREPPLFGMTVIEDLLDARDALVQAVRHFKLVIRCRDVHCFYDPTIQPSALLELRHRMEAHPRHVDIMRRAPRYRDRVQAMLESPSASNIDGFKSLAQEMVNLLDNAPFDIQLLFGRFHGIEVALALVRSVQEDVSFDAMIGHISSDDLQYLATHHDEVLAGCRTLWSHIRTYLLRLPMDNLPPLPVLTPVSPSVPSSSPASHRSVHNGSAGIGGRRRRRRITRKRKGRSRLSRKRRVRR